MPIKKILLPLDGSDLASQALPHAEEIARGTGAELVLFEVIENPLNVAVTQTNIGSREGVGLGAAMIVNATVDDAVHRHELDHAKSSLDQLAESLHHRKVNATTDIDTGDPAGCIVDYAANHQIDLIVMSSHGRTGLSRWAHGSVANKILHAAPCPVMVVTAKKLMP